MKDIYLDLCQRIGWEIQPVLSNSEYFAHSTLVSRPTLDTATIERWRREYPRCNWATYTGVSARLLIVELEGAQGWISARRLSKGSKRWIDTTQYKAGATSFLAFNYWGQPTYQIGRDLPGMRLHARGPILVPPSTLAGMQLEFVRIAPQLPDAPSWVLSECNSLAA